MGLFNSIRMGSSAAGDYEVKRSLRFNDDDSAYLNRTPSNGGDRRVFTLSWWIKLGNSANSTSTFTIFSAQRSTLNPSLEIRLQENRLVIVGNKDGSSSSYMFSLVTEQLFRDPTAWYHFVVAFNTSDSTASNRIKIYVNGSQITSFSAGSTGLTADTYPSSGDQTSWGTNEAEQQIGRKFGGSAYFDGYLAEINVVDGSQLTPSSFGETNADTGQWNPKKYVGSYGNSDNGYYLNFSNSSSLGTDSSGNGNNFTPNNFGTGDSVKDSPTNTFATWNPLSTKNLPTLSEGNLKNLSDNNKACNSTFGVTSGKWYWEMHILTDISSSNYIAATGVTSYQMENEGDTSPNLASAGRSYYRGMTSGGVYAYKNYTSTSHTEVSSGGTFYGGAVISFRLDMDAGTLKYYTNNTLVHTDSTIPTDGTVIFPMQNATNSGTSRHNASIINFGQDSTFAGNKTAQGNKDGNGNGDFYYSVPSGFKAMCSANLSDPSIAFPNQHFDTLLYTGNGSSQTISGLNFQPDWVWIKRREGENQFLTDSVRGAGLHLRSDQTTAESDNSDGFTSFTSDGFTLTGSGAAEPQINANGGTFVAWNWKGAGSTASNSDGSITTSVRANTTAGFSILTYTGNGSSGATIGHGLGVAPDVVIIKRRDGSNSWQVFHQSLGAGKFTDISSSSVAETNSNRWNDTAPTSSVITLGNNSNVNSNNGTCVGYVFSEVAGYSKFGSYTGNGNASGTFVFTGFRPALVVTKIIDTMSENWTMSDNKRSPINPVDLFSRPDETTGDTTGAAKMDFLSNGFKLRNTDDKTNKSGANYIYMAFAESPYKYSRAR